MAKVKKSKQLSFTMKNKVGLLSEVSRAIASAKVNITAICAYEMENEAEFMLITQSNEKVKKALSPLKVKIEEEDIITVEMPNKVGELQKVANKISDARIDIYYMYGTAGTGKSSICVFKTSDDKKAIRVINK